MMARFLKTKHITRLLIANKEYAKKEIKHIRAGHDYTYIHGWAGEHRDNLCSLLETARSPWVYDFDPRLYNGRL